MTPSGMINNVSEYQFVTGQNIDAQHPHGDLDRIIIDGGIMPLRSSSASAASTINWKNCLRGEDIAFLMEAYCERMNAMRYSYNNIGEITSQFSRIVGSTAVNDTGYCIRLTFKESGNGNYDTIWMKNGIYPTSPAVFEPSLDISLTNISAFLEAYQGYYYTLSDAQTPINPVPYQDRVLRQSTIETMFGDISKLYYLCMWDWVRWDYVFYNDKGAPEYSESVAIELPANQYISRFENFGIGAFYVHYWKSDPSVNKLVLIPMSLSSPPTPRDITATVFSLIGISDYEASGVISWVDGCVAGYFGELRSRTRWT